MTDMLILFPPQWSPFQPPLSIPSLTAWLKRDGFHVRALDANIDFYHWLYGQASISHCRELLRRSTCHSRAEKSAYEAILDSASDFAADLLNLQRLHARGRAPSETVFRSHFLAINSMEIFLDAISKISGTFKISPFSFATKPDTYNCADIQNLVDRPPSLLALFVDQYASERIASLNPSVVGISCIGMEQLFCSLLISKRVKQLLNIPVAIGGTIFSRIFERGAVPSAWFTQYFDVIVRNEGEKPASLLLDNVKNDRKLIDNVPGVVYLGPQGLTASVAMGPLKPSELPTPDFDDLPLDRYITSAVSLPLLSSRGCYWGKCEFCHHGMVYGDQYGSYEAETVLASIQHHAQRYGARNFAFNDEAIPPKIARKIGEIFPQSDETGWAFTGLIKFERYYTQKDFINLRRIGFRSLYVGLESASERVLTLMRKPNKQATVEQNLRDATEAGIWMHCFLFFGFPGETDDDAAETYKFMLENEDIIGSFGCGTFSLEHNAPIFRHLVNFGVQLEPASETSLDVYYRYSIDRGISAERAQEWADRLNTDARKKPKYFSSAWIPREHLLCLLESMSPEELVRAGKLLCSSGGISRSASTKEIFSSIEKEGVVVAINRSSQRVVRLEGASAAVFKIMYDEDLPLQLLSQSGETFYERLVAPAPC